MNKLSRREWTTLLVTVLAVIGFTFYSLQDSKPKNFSEIEAIKALTSVDAKSEEVLKLLERVGPVETQEALVRAGLPFTGETHLVVHTIGDYIFDNYGLEGLKYCRDYFLSACYHGFIINTLGEYGLQGVADSLESCRKSPIGVFAQCAHAAGHGFVAWHDYDLIKGLEMCDTLGEVVLNFTHYNCYDGAFMENVWGVHNGAPSNKRWVKESDIYYPCSETRIPEKYLRSCWGNQATLIYQHFQGDLRKTALACDEVANPEYKRTCYNNFARQIHPITQGNADKTLSLCANATGKEWQDYCNISVLQAAFSVGDRDMPFILCPMTGTLETQCFNTLVAQIKYYYPEITARRTYCAKITSNTHQKQCLE